MILKYGAGIVCWLIVFGYLQNKCIFSVNSVVDSLWATELHDDLIENVIGEVALHVSRGRCDNYYLFTVRYNPDGMDTEGATRSLTSLVDVKTWRETESDNITVTYADSKHRYRLYTFDESEYILAEDR